MTLARIEDCGLRIEDWGRLGSEILNPQSSILNPCQEVGHA